jgi:hypothetical protein
MLINCAGWVCKLISPVLRLCLSKVQLSNELNHGLLLVSDTEVEPDTTPSFKTSTDIAPLNFKILAGNVLSYE